MFVARNGAQTNRLGGGFSLSRGVELALLSGESVFWTASENRVPNDTFNLVFIASLVVVFACCGLLARRFEGSLPGWLYVKVAPTAMTCSLCLLATRGIVPGDAWMVAAGCLGGLGSALLFLGWQVWFASTEQACDARAMGRSFAAIPVVAFVILLAQFPLGSIVAIIAIWLSAFALESGLRNCPPHGASSTPGRLWHGDGLGYSMCALLIFAFIFGIGGQVSFRSSDSFLWTNAVSVGSVFIAGVVFLLFSNVIGGKTQSEEIYTLVAPVVITAIVILPFMAIEYGLILNAVIVVSYYLVNYNFLCYAARQCCTKGWNPVLVTGVSQSLVRAVMLVGIVGGSLFLANPAMEDFVKSTGLAFAVVYLLMVGLVRSIVVTRRRSKDASMLGQEEGCVAETDVHHFVTDAPGPSMASLCRLYRLTDREVEVLLGLVNGYSVKLVAEELGVSPNTVRTHVRSLYDKMDIHTKDDLIRFYQTYMKIDERVNAPHDPADA